MHDWQQEASGVKLLTFRQPASWFEMCDRLNPPSRLTAWCCSVFKAAALAKLFRDLNGHSGVLVFEGMRRRESTRRRNRPAIFEGGKIGTQVLARPIIDWRDAEVWLYILGNGLPYNSAYDKGLPRVGCLYCPHHSAAIDRLLETIYPTEMAAWREYIMAFAARIGKKEPLDYWKSGAWKSRVGNSESRDALRVAAYPCSIGDHLTNFVLKRSFDAKTVAEYLRPMGKVGEISTPLGPMLRVCAPDGAEFGIHGFEDLPRARLVIYQIPNTNRARLVQTIARQLRRFQCCVQCGACASVCRHGAIRVDPASRSYQVDPALCNACGACLDPRNLKSGCVKINCSYGSRR